ncbi:uncharacterized protein [Narcine bancroftii]|uniref:uncharacterized protein isoform X3 n=1 Tax=Narcine bancroftii TaxID=1343680 RepID=UPI0038318597
MAATKRLITDASSCKRKISMATSVDKSHSTTWTRFQSESTNRVVKLLRKSKSMDTLLETTSWRQKDIPDYDTVTTLLPTSLPIIPLTKLEILLQQHGQDNFLHYKQNFTTSKSCPLLVHSVNQLHCEEIPSITNQPEDVFDEETNQLAIKLDALTLESVQCTDDNKIPDQNDEFFSWAFESSVSRAHKSNIKDQSSEEFFGQEKEGLILENNYLSPTVTVDKLETQSTNAGPKMMEEALAGRNVIHSECFDMKEEIGSVESFEYSFTLSKRKIDYKKQQTKFTLEHFEGLDVDLNYSEELFDDNNDSTSLFMRKWTIVTIVI